MAGYTPEAAVEETTGIPDSIECEKCGKALDPILGRIRFGTTIDWSAWIPGSYEHRERPEPGGPCALGVAVTDFLGE